MENTKLLTSLAFYKTAEGIRTGYTFSEVDEGGNIVSSNNKGSLVLLPETMKEPEAHAQALIDFLTDKLPTVEGGVAVLTTFSLYQAPEGWRAIYNHSEISTAGDIIKQNVRQETVLLVGVMDAQIAHANALKVFVAARL